jgi:DNA polymerase sigma
MQQPARCNERQQTPFSAACLKLARGAQPSQRDYKVRHEALEQLAHALWHGLDWDRRGLTPPEARPFGSFPAGTFSPGSDLDVGVVTYLNGVPAVSAAVRDGAAGGTPAGGATQPADAVPV